MSANFKTMRSLLVLLCTLTFTGCASSGGTLATVERVDLKKFMGDWYVIATIPTPFEKGAHNALESYRLDDEGRIQTTFTFNKDSFDGPQKEYHPHAVVRDAATNAEWGMQFVWPFRADYRIAYLSEDYSSTIIGRNKRDYVWLMARKPDMSETDYQKMVNLIHAMDYDTNKLVRIPHSNRDKTNEK